MTEIFVGTDNATATNVLCESLHSFLSYGYEHGMCFFITKVILTIPRKCFLIALETVYKP